MNQNLPANCTIDLLCTHIAGGGFIHDLATLWNVEPYLIFKYLESTAEYRKRWNEATVMNGNLHADRIKSELAVIAYATVKDIYDNEGKLMPINKLSDKAARAISSVEMKSHLEGRGEDAVEVYITKVKHHDKLKALEMFGKECGLGRNKLTEALEKSLEELIGGSWGAKIPEAPPAPAPTTTPEPQPERHKFRTEVDLGLKNDDEAEF